MPDFLSSQDQWAIVGRQSPKEIMKQYGKSYYLATKFINPRKKNAIYNLYKLVRIPDLVVDTHQNHATNEQKKETLTLLRAHRHRVLDQRQYDDVFFGSVSYMVRDMKLNTTWIEAFWDAMERDTVVFRYHTRSDLCQYMYGSAEVVWLLMTQIIWYSHEAALPYAQTLWRAMQYANFLRDVREDWEELGRIYLPAQDLAWFWLTHEDIIHFCNTKTIDDRRMAYMKRAINRCDDLFEQSFSGLKYLTKFSRQAIYLAARLYQSILRKIENIDYNVFALSARTTPTEKFITLSRYVVDRSWLKK